MSIPGRSERGLPSAESSQERSSCEESDALAALGVVRLRADNPGALTLSGTNTWVVGCDPAWVIDPGPALVGHVDDLVALLGARGGLAGVALTHDHLDHRGAVVALLDRMPAPLAAGRGDADVRLREGTRLGPLEAVATPGHAPDHFALIYGGVCFTGDAVLGEGSVFIAADPGSLAGYLDALTRLLSRKLEVLCPGHGPPVWDPYDRIECYVEHRLDRERRLVEALAAGARSMSELLDSAWSDVPPQLRPAASVTLAAHLDKLTEEGRLPADVERPSLNGPATGPLESQP